MIILRLHYFFSCDFSIILHFFPICVFFLSFWEQRFHATIDFEAESMILGLSTQDLGSGFDADRGSGSKDHFTSTPPRFESELHAMLRRSACDPVHKCNARSLRCVWSSRETTLNPDWGSGSSESGFSACVESPIIGV